MPYGYTGQNLISQVKNNSGVFSISDIADLTAKGHLGGKLDLIEEQTLSSVSAVEFTNLKESEYITHIFYLNKFVFSGTDTLRARFSNDGGTTYEDTLYESAVIKQNLNSTSTNLFRNNYNTIDRIQQNTANVEFNTYFIVNNAGNSSRFTQFSWMSNGYASGADGFRQGLGSRRASETVDAIKFYLTSYNLTGTASLYGFRHI